jgi:hypothetical protein
MRKFFIVVCFLSTVLDGLATALGLCVAIQAQTIPGYIFATGGALIVIALMVSTRDVWGRGDAFHRYMRIFWFMGLFVNIAAVLLASFNHIILGKPLTDSINQDWQQVHGAGWMQIITILVLTAFLTGAPVAVSHLWKTFYDDEDEEILEPVREKKIPA